VRRKKKYRDEKKDERQKIGWERKKRIGDKKKDGEQKKR
jgi:hypothetical protein